MLCRGKIGYVFPYKISTPIKYEIVNNKNIYSNSMFKVTIMILYWFFNFIAPIKFLNPVIHFIIYPVMLNTCNLKKDEGNI